MKGVLLSDNSIKPFRGVRARDWTNARAGMCVCASSDDRWRATVFALFNDIQKARQNRIGGRFGRYSFQPSSRCPARNTIIYICVCVCVYIRAGLISVASLEVNCRRLFSHSFGDVYLLVTLAIELELELESFYSITTFIRAMTSLLQIRQVAHLMEHYMQPARTKPHARGAHKQPRPET